MQPLPDAYHHGGLYFVNVFAAAALGLIVAFAGAVVLALRRWVPALVFRLLAGPVLILGCIGRAIGHRMAEDAAARASAEAESAILHACLGSAAWLEAEAWVALVGLLLGSALLAALGLLVGARPEGRWRPVPAALSLVIAAGGSLVVAGVHLGLHAGLGGGPAPLLAAWPSGSGAWPSRWPRCGMWRSQGVRSAWPAGGWW
ncbi:MAG: hypothetical protein ABIO70_02355 [Pseudomonadota bacterium]